MNRRKAVQEFLGQMNRPLGRIMLVLTCLLIGIFIFGSFLIGIDPTATSLDIFSSPNQAHLLGTNDVGQDIMARLLAGGRNSLIAAVGVGLLSTVFSLLGGALAGLHGGRIDRLIMRTVDVLLVIPHIVIIILVASYLTPTLVMEILIISFLVWTGGARIVRAQVLSLKERTHIHAALSFGAERKYIFFTHLLPELTPLVVILFLQGARRAVFIEAGLAFIGVVDPNIVSWGSMISHALRYFYLDVWQWWLLPVAGALTLTMLIFTTLGYMLEETVFPFLGGKRNDY